ncbi:hypothetical protein NPIL_500061 [Nephila pilipes]|uniref:Receptor ligand binding region domain-containing protein n=1 Tax=Nephila pilipes TaxID=299642 RepID=A0A8X6TY34_NEPPI|nr:hypothetical protein NPIL_500061 [Nephila pilipes]
MTRQPHQPHASLDHWFGIFCCGGLTGQFSWTLHSRTKPMDIQTQCHMGFSAASDDIEKLLIAGAVPLAVDLVNDDPELLPFHNLRFIAYDAGDAESSLPLKKMTQMKEEGVAGFIGLDGSCEHEALLAAAWDMTMFSYVSISYIIPSRNAFRGQS